MVETEYPAPVNRLLTYGDARNYRDWPNYLELGIGPQHIPDLIRMATDEALNQGDPESLDVWAPIHAWRALAQLRAEESAEPLLGLLHRIDDDLDDWIGEDLPEALGMIGPAAIPALADYLSDDDYGLYARVAAARALEEIAKQHPESRDAVVAALSRQLERFEAEDPTLNAFLIGYLVDLRATECASLMERAFASESVDEIVMGDWEDVQVKLGLKGAREHPRRPLFISPPVPRAPVEEPSLGAEPSRLSEAVTQPRTTAKAKAKAKRKQAAQSRRRNRGR